MEFRFDSPGQCPGRRPVIAWGEGQRPNPSDAAGCTPSEICRSNSPPGRGDGRIGIVKGLVRYFASSPTLC